MSGESSCCLSCAVHNGDLEELNNLLDSCTLSDSPAWFLGTRLLWRAIDIRLDRIEKFLVERDAGANSENELTSEMNLYWNGTPVGSPDGTNNIEIMERISKVNYLVDKPTTCQEYLGSLQMAALINNTEITEVLLRHLRRNGTLPRCDVPISNLKTLKLLLQSIIYVEEKSHDRHIALSIATHMARIEISKVLFNPLYFNTPDDLYSAAEMDSTALMEELLSQNADVEARFHDLTPLHIAAQLGHTRSAEILLAHGANPESVCDSALRVLLHAAVKESKDTLVELLLREVDNVTPKYKGTLLHLAAAQRSGKVFKLLWNYGAGIDEPDENNKNILSLAVERHDSPLIEHIIEVHSDLGNNRDEMQCNILEALRRKGFEISPEDARDCSLFQAAVRSGCREIVKYLLKFGANFNIGSELEYNVTSLHTAVKFKQIEIVRLLICYKADVNAKTSCGQTPLHYALEMVEANEICTRDIAKILLNSGARVDEGDRNGTTALQIATNKGYKKVVELLCEHEANVNHVDEDKKTLLHKQLTYEHIEIVRLLLKYNADVNAKDMYDKTPLLHVLNFNAKETRIRDIAKILLDSGARVDETDRDGTTALQIATNKGYEKVVELLCENEADVNHVDTYMRTLLHCEPTYKHIEIVRLLIKYNADVNAKSGIGSTPLLEVLTFDADETWIRDIAKILLESGARVNQHDQSRTTALHMAAMEGYQKVVELLCKHKADVNVSDELNTTPLHYSVLGENEIMVKTLLDEGANVNAVAIDGETPISMAVRTGCAKVVKLLMENGADINNYKDHCQMSLLHIASMVDSSDSSEIAEMLLNAFDDIDCRGLDEHPPLYFATVSKNVKMVRCLLDHGSDINRLPIGDGQSLRPARYSEEINIILTHHRVKMTALNPCEKYLSPMVLSAYITFYTQCTNEIERMRRKKIGVSSVSYYDLLTKGMRRLALYSRNKDIVDALEKEDHGDMFHLYSAMLRNRFKNGQKRATLLESGSKSLRDLTGYSLPDTPFIKFCDYLTNGDLRNLIKAACNVSDN